MVPGCNDVLVGEQRGRRSGVLTDLRPLRHSADYRRVWTGQTISNVGAQMTIVATGYQVYRLTESSFAVGLIGLCSLLPLVAGGLYGGALVDAYDRRTVALWSAVGLWVCSIAFFVQALLGNESVGLLYGLVAVQSAMFAVNNPARGAMLPRLLPAELLPAANALGMAAFTLGFSVGALAGGAVIAWHGVEAAYGVDVLTFTASLYALVRLPRMPPPSAAPSVPGLRSVVDGLVFLRRAPNVRSTFVVDVVAMVFAQPRALMPALALSVFSSSASTLGLLQAAPAVGSFLAFLVSGWVSGVRRQGVAVLVAVAVYGAAVAVAGFAATGAAGLLWLCVGCIAVSGGADMVSSAFRSTILQTAAPDELRGRMQGIFTLVVAGGPRMGDFLIGALAAGMGEAGAMVLGGSVCVVLVGILAWRQPRFRAYDARAPQP